jgi:hypothetical protein
MKELGVAEVVASTPPIEIVSVVRAIRGNIGVLTATGAIDASGVRL